MDYYADFDQIAIDRHPHNDADESNNLSVVPKGASKGAEQRPVRSRELLLPASTPNVPFCRSLSEGDSGDDVVAHKRALSRWNPRVYPWSQFTRFYGPYLTTAVKEFQRHHRLKQDGVIGALTHAALEQAHTDAGEPVFDSLATHLAASYCQEHSQTPEERVRTAIVAAGFYWYAHRWQITYSQTRPFGLGHPPWVPQRWDCSACVTGCHFAGGAPDPNRRGYDGQGYTGTLIGNGTHVHHVSELQPADLIFYGFSRGNGPAFPPGSPTHVALYVGDEMVLSQGSYPMRHASYNYRSDVNALVRYRVA